MIITQLYVLTFIMGLILTALILVADLPAMGDRLKKLRGVLAFVLLLVIIWLCIQNFPLTLTLLVICCGIIGLIDILFFQRKRESRGRAQPLIVEYARSFFWVLFIVWVIRSFIIQPYRVPTGSLQPTVQPGDFLVVNQFAYGLRFPVLNKKLVPVGEPKRGDIVLFYWPADPAIVFVKRLIGLPGDHVVYKDKVLYVNGKEMKQQDLGNAVDDEPSMGNIPEQHIPVQVKNENFEGIDHKIFINPGVPIRDLDVTVPPGHYFMMGDNRDNSDDSRDWGFVPERMLIGKAFGIWLSWDSINHRFRWDRIGKAVH